MFPYDDVIMINTKNKIYEHNDRNKNTTRGREPSTGLDAKKQVSQCINKIKKWH